MVDGGSTFFQNIDKYLREMASHPVVILRSQRLVLNTWRTFPLFIVKHVSQRAPELLLTFRCVGRKCISTSLRFDKGIGIFSIIAFIVM
jgi:hypothetical protein